jgi:hypothetical protein
LVKPTLAGAPFGDAPSRFHGLLRATGFLAFLGLPTPIAAKSVRML